jgi:superfamily II DNA or RNA helicase
MGSPTVIDDNSGPAVRFDRGLLVSPVRADSIDDIWRYDPRRGEWVTDASNNARLGVPFGDDAAAWQRLTFSRTKIPPLREEQLAATQAWSRTRQGVIVMPTGTGKTEVAFEIMRQVQSHTLFVVPTRALAYQLAGRIEATFGLDVGFIGDHTYRLRPVSVTTYESACIKMERVGDYFKLLIFDECHHLTGNLRLDAARMSAAPLRLGLTATPGRTSAGIPRPFEDLIGPICFELPLSVVRGKDLADYEIKRIPVFLTDDEQNHYDALGKLIREHMAEHKRVDPRYGWENVSRNTARDPEARHVFLARFKRRSIEESAVAKLDVLEDLFRKHSQQVVVFTGANVMARMVSTRFLIPCLLAHSSRAEREEVLDGYLRGEYKAVVANRVLNEGVDIPNAKVGIIIGGTASEDAAVQRLGRILRKKTGQDATLYEVVCAGTTEEERSRKRRKSDAYKRPSLL